MVSNVWRNAMRLALGLAFASGIAVAARRKGSLSGSGAIAATVVGSAAYSAGGWMGVRALLSFFISSSMLSQLPMACQRARPNRNAGQVIANGGVATLCWILHALRVPGAWEQAAVCSLTTAAADTWATEIGQRWGGTPRLISSGMPAVAGESGGVTALGSVAALAGATLVGLIALAGSGSAPSIAVTIAAGMSGSAVDSVLGATLQARFRCPDCGARTEHPWHCGSPGDRLWGISWITNDTVNLMATLVGAAIGIGTRRRSS